MVHEVCCRLQPKCKFLLKVNTSYSHCKSVVVLCSCIAFVHIKTLSHIISTSLRIVSESDTRKKN